jgi:hypothetical protein
MRFHQLHHDTDIQTIYATAEQIEQEPMFYNADVRLVRSTDAPLTRRWLAAMGVDLYDTDARWSLDTRSHMLMRGWFPAIPGWHHDDVDRGDMGQPDYDADWVSRPMRLTVVDADDQPTGSLTEWIVRQPVSVTWPLPGDEPVYRYWDNQIESDQYGRWTYESGRTVAFDSGDFHRAMPAKSSGWRWFARLCLNPGQRGAAPKIRRQCQVYLPTTNKGW